MFGPKPQLVYHRPDLPKVENKIILFPTLDFNGKKSKGAIEINNKIQASWSNLYGADRVLSADLISDEISKKFPDFYINLIKSIDNISIIEQLHKNQKIRDALSEITAKLGNHHLGFSIINGGSEEFSQDKKISIHTGIFDTKNLTWKWITKIEDKKDKISNWDIFHSTLIANSFEYSKNIESKK